MRYIPIIQGPRGTWLSQLEGQISLDLREVSSRPTLGVRKIKIQKNKMHDITMTYFSLKKKNITTGQITTCLFVQQ